MLAALAFPVMLVILVATTLAGLPMGIAMIVSSIYYLLISGRDVGLGAERVLNGIFGNFAALAVPFFIFAANIMDAGRNSDRLLTFCLALVGRIRELWPHLLLLIAVLLLITYIPEFVLWLPRQAGAMQ